MKSKLFTKCPDIEKRTIRHRVWVNVEEDAGIKEAAAIRKLSVAEYMRRAALGRRADVRYEVDIVLQLSSIVRTIRAMHIDLVERGIETTAAGFRPVIEEAISAMLRIEGKGSLLYGSHSMEACSQ